MSLASTPPVFIPPWVLEELHRLEQQGLLRLPIEVLSREPGKIQLREGSLVDFTSNDYLGLSRHPACVEAARRALVDHGCGSGSSRIVTGHSSLQATLEASLAAWLGSSATVLFASGYQANLGVVSALLGPEDLVFSDAQNHASLVDGCRLSRATIQVYPHLDAAALEASLATASPTRRKLVITDSLFSMDGELAPLVALQEACRLHGALLVVDEAHALGVLGPDGSGLCRALGVEPTLTVGTLSKALGSQGAFVAGARPWIHYLWNRARPLIYSTALPPASIGASLAAVEVVQSKEGAALRAFLAGSSAKVHALLERRGVRATGKNTPLVSLGFEDAGLATRLQRQLRQEALLTWAFRPPTVPQGTSRLRISLCAAHREPELTRLAAWLVEALGLHPGPLPGTAPS